jgi:hypothetical protein
MFERMLTEPRLHEIPMVVETDPEEDMEGHHRDLNVLRGLVGLKKKRRRRANSPSGRSAG